MKKILTDFEHKEHKKESNKRYREAHKDYYKKYREEHKKDKKYTLSKNSRASKLLYSYNQEDKKHNRGQGDLTVKWIVENIFSKPCAHCGKIGWKVIGCNRLDNSKPHSIDNIEPCCSECNKRLPRK